MVFAGKIYYTTICHIKANVLNPEWTLCDFRQTNIFDMECALRHLNIPGVSHNLRCPITILADRGIRCHYVRTPLAIILDRITAKSDDAGRACRIPGESHELELFTVYNNHPMIAAVGKGFRNTGAVSEIDMMQWRSLVLVALREVRNGVNGDEFWSDCHHVVVRRHEDGSLKLDGQQKRHSAGNILTTAESSVVPSKTVVLSIDILA
jgi:hypothetical protein